MKLHDRLCQKEVILERETRDLENVVQYYYFSKIQELFCFLFASAPNVLIYVNFDLYLIHPV